MFFLKEAKDYEKQMIDDLRSLIKIYSVYDEESVNEKMPFGKNISLCLEKALEIGKRDGFKVDNVDGYAGLIQYGDLEDSIGILGHLDVVPVGDDWSFDPFEGILKDGYIIGRGSCDDKGPTIAAYYAMKILKDKGYKLKHNIQLILGTDEENMSRGILHYKNKCKNPLMGIVPDADFPCIFAEKGILDMISEGRVNTCIKTMKAGNAFNVVAGKCEAIVLRKVNKDYFNKFLIANGLTGSFEEKDGETTYRIIGKPFHASKPYHGVNAAIMMWKFIGSCYGDEFSLNVFKIFDSPYGTSLNVECEGAYMGDLTFNLGKVELFDGRIKLSLDFRYPNEIEGDKLFKNVSDIIEKTLGLKSVLIDDSKWLLNDPESQLIKTCLKHYRKFSKDEYTPALRIGGGTYARSFENFVACGPIFPTRKYAKWVGKEHEADEGFEVETMVIACAIYANILKDLACE